MYKIIVTLLVCMILVSCREQTVIESPKVDQFVHELHHKIKKKDFNNIYQSSAPEFKSQINEDAFVKSMAKIYSILGTPTESSIIGHINTTSSNGKALIAAQYSTKFEHGTAIETVYLEKAGEKLVLFQYNINSDDLMKKVLAE